MQRSRNVINSGSAGRSLNLYLKVMVMLFHTVFRVLIVTAYVGEKLVTTKRCCYGVGLCRSDSRYGHREHMYAVPKASHGPRQMLALDNSVQTGWFWGEAVLVPTRLPNIGPTRCILLGKRSKCRTPRSHRRKCFTSSK